jgi:hypothetical protein
MKDLNWQTSKWDFQQLQRRAEQQTERTEAERIRATRRVFAGTTD